MSIDKDVCNFYLKLTRIQNNQLSLKYASGDHIGWKWCGMISFKFSSVLMLGLSTFFLDFWWNWILFL